MKKIKHAFHAKLKLPKLGGGFSEGSSAEEAGESTATEAGEGGQGFKRGGHVSMPTTTRHGHSAMASSTKHGHRPM